VFKTNSSGQKVDASDNPTTNPTKFVFDHWETAGRIGGYLSNPADIRRRCREMKDEEGRRGADPVRHDLEQQPGRHRPVLAERGYLQLGAQQVGRPSPTSRWPADKRHSENLGCDGPASSCLAASRRGSTGSPTASCSGDADETTVPVA